MKNRYASVRDRFLDALEADNIEYVMKPFLDGYVWTFPFKNDADVVVHEGSYNNDTCVESMGWPWDGTDVTSLQPEVMAQMIAHSDLC